MFIILHDLVTSSLDKNYSYIDFSEWFWILLRKFIVEHMKINKPQYSPTASMGQRLL